MDGWRIYYLVVGLISTALLGWMSYRVYNGFRRGRMNANGMGAADMRGSPIIFSFFTIQYVIIILFALYGVYFAYIGLFGRIPGFYPEPVIDAITKPIRYLLGSNR